MRFHAVELPVFGGFAIAEHVSACSPSSVLLSQHQKVQSDIIARESQAGAQDRQKRIAEVRPDFSQSERAWHSVEHVGYSAFHAPSFDCEFSLHNAASCMSSPVALCRETISRVAVLAGHAPSPCAGHLAPVSVSSREAGACKVCRSLPSGNCCLLQFPHMISTVLSSE